MIDLATLKQICGMPFDAFERFGSRHATPGGDYFFKDRGEPVLGVAHLDTVLPDAWREEPGMVFTPALDDRLGAYILIDLLPRLGVSFDLLLTDGEEMGRSTARRFQPPRQYNWMFSFDRAGTDVVLYQYEDREMVELLGRFALRVARGTFSDICFLEHLGCKGLNVGCGYHLAHTRECHAVLDETRLMISRFIYFYRQHRNTSFPYRSPFIEEGWEE